MPTLWQGCAPPHPADFANGRVGMADCQASLGEHFSDIGYIVAVSAISRELWTVPKRTADGRIDEESRGEFIDFCEHAAHCLEPWEHPWDSTGLRRRTYGATSTRYVHQLVLEYLDDFRATYSDLPRFAWFHSFHAKLDPISGGGSRRILVMAY